MFQNLAVGLSAHLVRPIFGVRRVAVIELFGAEEGHVLLDIAAGAGPAGGGEADVGGHGGGFGIWVSVLWFASEGDLFGQLRLEME